MDAFEEKMIQAYRNKNYYELLTMIREKVKIIGPKQAETVFDKWKSKEQEYFLVALLDSSNAPIKVIEAAKGRLNSAFIDSREVFREAIKNNTASIIIGHNHPSGDLTPSIEDRNITNKLVEAGKILGIRIIDHIIVSKLGFYSFKEHDEIK